MCQGSHVFSSMTKNVVCLAEDRLERLYQKRLLGQWELLEARELLPIFYRALLEPQSVHDSYSWDGAARSGLLGSILVHSGTCFQGKATMRVSDAASTTDHTAWGTHKT